MEGTRQIDFAKKLVDWYWKWGCKRADRYVLSPGGWVRQLYDSWRELEAIEEASGQPRPAMAIWGPSQTGKSTLVSAFVDRNAVFTGKAGEDGCKSGLHWEGGAPAFFMAPKLPDETSEAYPAHLLVLNPFNGGKDASACLTRFCLGTRTPGGRGEYVSDPRYPVRMFLVKTEDLWHALARGYDSECLGPNQATRSATVWNSEKFDRLLAQTRREFAATAPNREAFEALHHFTTILNDLVFAQMPRFEQLLEQGPENWKSRLAGLMGEKALVGNRDAVEKFAAQLFWDGYQPLSDYFVRLRKASERFSQQWGGKPVRISLRAAALFLDMDSYKMFAEPRPVGASPQSKECQIHDIVPRLGWRDCGEFAAIDADSALPNRLVGNPDDYGVLQGLVWELVVPLNPDNLPESSFKKFLQASDLLDFPGVGNEKNDKATKIDLDPARSAGASSGADDPAIGVPFQPQQFYLRILKRGKTASIVSTYAKRLTIDAFSIFQSLDTFPCPNAQQLINGIMMWWKHFVPAYYARPEGTSPLPLNLGLCWWAKMINEAPLNTATLLGNKQANLDALGKIADPDTCTTFALNYYQFYRGRVDRPFDADSSLAKVVRSEDIFSRLFKRDLSRRSFEEMLADQETGGTNFFFSQLHTQMETLAANPVANRRSLLAAKAADAATRLAGLLRENELFPRPRTRDARKEDLLTWQKELRALIKDQPENVVREINFTVRELVDVDAAGLLAVPADAREITATFIHSEFQRWAERQRARFEAPPSAGGNEPDWALSGVQNTAQLSDLLQAFCASTEPLFPEMAEWLRRLVVRRPQTEGFGQSDLRHPLAVNMANQLAFRFTRSDPDEADPERAEWDPQGDEGVPADEPRGTACFFYKSFLGQFVEDQLTSLINLQLRTIDRPDNIPGDEEIRALCAGYDMAPTFDT